MGCFTFSILAEVTQLVAGTLCIVACVVMNGGGMSASNVDLHSWHLETIIIDKNLSISLILQLVCKRMMIVCKDTIISEH